MSLLTAPVIKNSHTLAGLYFIFLKNILQQASKSLNTEFGPQWNDDQVRQNLAFFGKLVALILDWNQVKDPIDTRIVKKN